MECVLKIIAFGVLVSAQTYLSDQLLTSIVNSQQDVGCQLTTEVEQIGSECKILQKQQHAAKQSWTKPHRSSPSQFCHWCGGVDVSFTETI